MKKAKSDKNQRASGPHVETPPPPQVMDPSSYPSNQDDKKNKGTASQPNKSRMKRSGHR